MKIQVGYEFIYNFPQATQMILTTNVPYSRASEILVPELRDGPSYNNRMAAVREYGAWWGAGTGDLRFCALQLRDNIAFDYQHSRAERTGVCRDYTHLAVTFCRCLNIPARYCTGYLGDTGIPPPYGVMDFAAWFDAYSHGRR